jgi:DNA damage-inducible protein 1
LDLDAQRRIEELIRLEQVQRNMEQALELNPESFGRVVMLYIDCEINGVPVKAFVDSGAQITLMSQQTAERCGILRLVDRRFSNTLVGVGTCQAIGRIHSADIMIGESIFSSSFTVVEDSKMEFLLGLDMLRKHRVSL